MTGICYLCLYSVYLCIQMMQLKVDYQKGTFRNHFGIYSEIPLLRRSKIKTSYLLKTLFPKFKLFFSSFSTPSPVYLWLETTFDSPKGGLNIGILLYSYSQLAFFLQIAFLWKVGHDKDPAGYNRKIWKNILP